MDPKNNISTIATCTTCTFSEDFSNYWTAVLYFRARNGTFKRVPQKGNVNFETANGGITSEDDYLGEAGIHLTLDSILFATRKRKDDGLQTSTFC